VGTLLLQTRRKREKGGNFFVEIAEAIPTKKMPSTSVEK